MSLLTKEQLEASLQPLDADHLPENGQAIIFQYFNRQLRKGVFYLPNPDAEIRNHIGYLSETDQYCIYSFYSTGPHMAITGWCPDPEITLRRDVDFLLGHIEAREQAFKEVLQSLMKPIKKSDLMTLGCHVENHLNEATNKTLRAAASSLGIELDPS